VSDAAQARHVGSHSTVNARWLMRNVRPYSTERWGAMPLTAAEVKTLTEELSVLSRQQTEALERAAFLKMSQTDSSAYNKRRERVAQLWELLRDYMGA